MTYEIYDTENDDYARGVVDGITAMTFAEAMMAVPEELPETVDDMVFFTAMDTADYVCDLIDYADEMLDLIDGRAEYYDLPDECAQIVYEG